MYRLKYFSANALAFTAEGKAFSFLFDLYLSERFEILLDVGPFKTEFICRQALIKSLACQRSFKAVT